MAPQKVKAGKSFHISEWESHLSKRVDRENTFTWPGAESWRKSVHPDGEFCPFFLSPSPV